MRLMGDLGSLGGYFNMGLLGGYFNMGLMGKHLNMGLMGGYSQVVKVDCSRVSLECLSSDATKADNTARCRLLKHRQQVDRVCNSLIYESSDLRDHGGARSSRGAAGCAPSGHGR